MNFIYSNIVDSICYISDIETEDINNNSQMEDIIEESNIQLLFDIIEKKLKIKLEVPVEELMCMTFDEFVKFVECTYKGVEVKK